MGESQMDVNYNPIKLFTHTDNKSQEDPYMWSSLNTTDRSAPFLPLSLPSFFPGDMFLKRLELTQNVIGLISKA